MSATSSRISPWLARLLYPLGSKVVLPAFFNKITVTGQANIPEKNPVIVAPTHRSRWDALLVPYAMGRMVSGRDMRFMVSINEVSGLQGWFIRRMGGFPVNPARPTAGSLQHSIELLQDDEMLVIFPEGAIFRDRITTTEVERQVQPLKRGVARIALDVVDQNPDTEVNIIPVSIRYSEAIPQWGADVWIEIGKPINAAEYLEESVRRASINLTKALQEQLQQLHQETPPTPELVS